MATETKDRNKAIDLAISQIEKQFGRGSIMKMGEIPKEDVPVIPTGSLSLDHALGIGGVPRGRVIEIFGPESSGKTTLAMHIVAGRRKWVVQQHSLMPNMLLMDYAAKLGVNIDSLLISQPDTGEQALDIAGCWYAAALWMSS